MKPLTPKQNWLVGLLLVAATFIAYQPMWQAGFIWDDDGFLLNNPLIHRPNGLFHFWFTTSAPDYFPLTSTTLWLEWRLWGEKPLGYHLVNVLLHALSAVLWWRVLEKLRMPLPWLAAALFALHPVAVDSVAWITERKNTLSMFFFALSLLCYLKADAQRWYWLSLLAFLCALLSKTAPVMLPFVLLLCDWWRSEQKKFSQRELFRVAPFFLLSLALGLVTVWFQHHRAISGDASVVRADSLPTRIAGAGWAIWFYLFKALLPVNLSFVYPRWKIDTANPLVYAPALLVVAALLFFWLKRERWGKGWFFALAYFVLLLLPILGFLNIYFMRYSLVADRWNYFSIIAPMVLLAAGTGCIANHGGQSSLLVSKVLGGVLLLAFGLLTWEHSGTYQDPETLWRTTVARNPSSAMAWNCLGDAVLQNGKLEEAISYFEKSLAIDPGDPLVQNNLAAALLRRGQANKAIAVLENGLVHGPKNGEPQNNLAWLLATCPIDSIRDGRRAVELARDADKFSSGKNPMFVDTLAAAYAETGDFVKAIAAVERATKLADQQKSQGLVEMLQARIKLYRSGVPFRDETLMPDARK